MFTVPMKPGHARSLRLARRNWDVFIRVEGFIVLVYLASAWARWEFILPTVVVVVLFLISLLEKRLRVLRTAEITCWIFLAATLIYTSALFWHAASMDSDVQMQMAIMKLITYVCAPSVFVQGMRATRRYRRLAMKEERRSQEATERTGRDICH